MFIIFSRLPEKSLNFLQKLIHLNEQGISCIEILVSSNFGMQNDGPVLATGDRIYGPLNWAYITVMPMGKYHLLL